MIVFLKIYYYDLHLIILDILEKKCKNYMSSLYYKWSDRLRSHILKYAYSRERHWAYTTHMLVNYSLRTCCIQYT